MLISTASARLRQRTTKQSAVPCITAIHHIRNPEEDSCKSTQPEPGEGNAQRSKAQCRASRQSIISGIRRRIPANQHRLNGVKSIHHPLQFLKLLPFKQRAFSLSRAFLSVLASWRDPISGLMNPSYWNSTFCGAAATRLPTPQKTLI